jgi:hypothetical protein
MLPLLLLACAAPDPSAADQAPPPLPGWTIAVWMDGDNDLEPLVPRDLDELERGMDVAGADVRVLVQADRIDGYSTRDGDWTGTRRYDIAPDAAPGVTSPWTDVGERDMGDPAELAEFLEWAHATSPTEHLAVVLWNHGGGFWIASDDTSGSLIAITGELQDALQPVIDARGAPIDVVAFDACNMAEWELAHALAPQADVLVASEAWVGDEGLAYDLALTGLDASVDARTFGGRLARSAGVRGELTMSAVDLRLVPDTTAAVDALATAWLAHPAGLADFARARRAAAQMDRDWRDWWVDLATLGDAAATSRDAAVSAAGRAVADAVDDATIASFGRIRAARGLTIWAVTGDARFGRRYTTGAWAADTAWDELLIAASRAAP